MTNLGDQFEPDELNTLTVTIFTLKQKLKEYGGHKFECGRGDYAFMNGHWGRSKCTCGWDLVEKHILEGIE